jgi:DNA repair protein RecO (recombination protein O)
MTLLKTDAIVLHVADYLESSRILRLVTREAGVQSVVARGARSSRKRFGSAVDLFAQGQAQIQSKPGRDLHALVGFDVTVARSALALDLGRFTAASAIAECALRLVHEEAAPTVFETLVTGLDQLAEAASAETVSVSLGALWRLVSEIGYRPSMGHCAECHAAVDVQREARFSVSAGGALCALCARRAPGARLLPPDAWAALEGWLTGQGVSLDAAAGRAHQRLLREFLQAHLPERRPLKAFLVWEQGHW